jgi:hypothetical protein
VPGIAEFRVPLQSHSRDLVALALPVYDQTWGRSPRASSGVLCEVDDQVTYAQQLQDDDGPIVLITSSMTGRLSAEPIRSDRGQDEVLDI